MTRKHLGQMSEQLQSCRRRVHIALDLSRETIVIVDVLDALDDSCELRFMLCTDVILWRHTFVKLYEFFAQFVRNRPSLLRDDLSSILASDYL